MRPGPQSSSGRAPLWYGGNRRSIRRCGTINELLALHSWRNGRRSRLRSGRPRAWRFKSSRVHHFCLRAVMPEACFQHDTPILRAELASPSGQGIGLTHRHSQVRVLERAPNVSPVAQRQSARPITGRPRFDTVRESQPRETTHKETIMTTIIKPARLAAAPPSPMDPERSSLSRLGNGLLIRAQEVQLLPGPPTHDPTHD
jgi:hypothetical protein